MTSTLDDPRVRTVLERCYAEAAASTERFHRERAELIAAGTGPGTPEYAAAARLAHMAVPPEVGRLLHLLVRSRRAATVVEFGTSFGISALHLAAGLRDNGGGTLTTTELEPTKAAAARATLAEAGLDGQVTVLVGDARETLARACPDGVELLFLDGANFLYLDVLDVVEPHLAPGALVVADNAGTPGYREAMAVRPGYVTAPAGERVEVSLRG